MFKELAPILEKRALTLTIARLPKSNLICLTVIPTQTDDDKDIDKASLEPLRLDPATAEDLDAGLAEALTSFTTGYMTLQESVDQAKANMEAALQASKDEAKRKTDEAKKKTVVPGKASVAAKSSPTKPEPPEPEPSKTRSLFDAPATDESSPEPSAAQLEPAAPGNPMTETTQAGSAPADVGQPGSLFPSIQSTEDEILAEVNAADDEAQSNDIAA